MKKVIITLLILFSVTSFTVCQEDLLQKKAHDALKLLQTFNPIPVVRNNDSLLMFENSANF